MARPKIHTTPTVRAVAKIEKSLYKLARQKAIGLDLRGGFGEYVARLIRADLRNKGSAALRVGRFIEAV